MAVQRQGIYRSLRGQTRKCKWCGMDCPLNHPNKEYCNATCRRAAAKKRRLQKAVREMALEMVERLAPQPVSQRNTEAQ